MDFKLTPGLVRCPSAGQGAYVTPETAREQYHSFGGSFPPEVVNALEQQGTFADIASDFGADAPELPLQMEAGGSLVYPEEVYRHPENIATCDTCGHRCMDPLS